MTRSTTKKTLLLAAACGLIACSADTDAPPVPCEGAGTICTLMGNGIAGLGTDGAGPLDISLYLVQDLAFGPDSRPYVLDWNNHRVRVIDHDGLVRTLIGTGELGDAPDGPALDASLNHPTHVSFSPTGKLILAAWHNSKVMEMDLGTGHMKAVCGDGSRSYFGDGGPANLAKLDLPVSTAFDSLGRMYIMDQANQRIRRIAEDGTIEVVVGPPPDFVPEGGVRVCTDEADESTCRNCTVDTADLPECTPAWPKGFGGDGGPGTEALMQQSVSQSAPPSGRIEMGPDDSLYWCDTNNHRVRVLQSDGTVHTVAGSGSDEYVPNAPGGYAGDGGPATEARFNLPVDVAVDTDGTLFVADTQNNCVRMVTPDGIIHRFAGRCGVKEKGYDGDYGDPLEARLNRPYGVALDAAGNLYIADTHNHRVRVVYR